MALIEKNGRALRIVMEGQSCWAFAISRWEKGKGEREEREERATKLMAGMAGQGQERTSATTNSDSGRQGSWLDRKVGSCWRRTVGS